MKAGDIIRFTKTGRVATVLHIGQEFVDDSSFTASVFIHAWVESHAEKKNPALFRLQHLRDIAEVISEQK